MPGGMRGGGRVGASVAMAALLVFCGVVSAPQPGAASPGPTAVSPVSDAVEPLPDCAEIMGSNNGAGKAPDSSRISIAGVDFTIPAAYSLRPLQMTRDGGSLVLRVALPGFRPQTPETAEAFRKPGFNNIVTVFVYERIHEYTGEQLLATIMKDVDKTSAERAPDGSVVYKTNMAGYNELHVSQDRSFFYGCDLDTDRAPNHGCYMKTLYRGTLFVSISSSKRYIKKFKDVYLGVTSLLDCLAR